MAGPFPTTTTTTCREKFTSVTLAEGEQFVLPPEATLIAATNVSALTHDGCLDTSQLEELVCYEIVMFIADICGGGSKPFTNDSSSDYFLTKFIINGVNYDFNDISAPSIDVPYFDLSPLLTHIANPANGLSGIILDPCWQWGGDGSQGTATHFVFKTFPSIGDNMEIEAYTNGLNIGGTNFYWKAKPYGTWGGLDQSEEGFGSCSCSTGSSPQV